MKNFAAPIEANNIAEGTVHRVTEGTSTVLVQSDVHEGWWREAMEC